MPEKIYSFNGKDITMNICIQIRDVVKLLQEHFHIAFEEAVLLFYKSETYKTLQETENGLWAESAEYIADRYYEEQGKKHFSYKNVRLRQGNVSQRKGTTFPFLL